MTPAAVLGFFANALRSAENNVELAEKRAIMRALRAIYFYPDQVVSEIDKIIDSGGMDISPLAQIKAMMERSEAVIKKEIDFLTSPSVTTNLSMPTAVIHNLREATSLKRDVRAKLVGMFFTYQFKADDAEVVSMAQEAKRAIELLNSRILELERALT